MKDQINTLMGEVANAALTTPESVEAFRIAYLGRKGKMKDLMAAFKEVPGDQKRELGPMLNALKQAVENKVARRNKRPWPNHKPQERTPPGLQADCPLALTIPCRWCDGKSSKSSKTWALLWRKA